MAYFDILVPTIDLIKFTDVIEKLLMQNKNIFLTGETGTGKSVLLVALLKKMNDIRRKVPRDTISIIFSA